MVPPFWVDRNCLSRVQFAGYGSRTVWSRRRTPVDADHQFLDVGVEGDRGSHHRIMMVDACASTSTAVHGDPLLGGAAEAVRRLASDR